MEFFSRSDSRMSFLCQVSDRLASSNTSIACNKRVFRAYFAYSVSKLKSWTFPVPVNFRIYCALAASLNKIQTNADTVWAEGFLYKVAPPELKNSPIMYFVIHNSVVLSKILKIVVPYEQNFENSIFDSIKLIILIIIDIDKQESKWHNDFQYFG